MNEIVLDTHTFIWMLSKSSALSDRARSAISQAQGDTGRLSISAITIVELAYLVEKRRIKEDLWLEMLAMIESGETPLRVEPVTSEVAAVIRQIPRPVVPDMPDRIIAATALELGVPLISKDEQIARLDNVEVIW